ncbi:MAG: hypothetical protein QG597_621, partial [Actinomycetota bacterium]|nr:hypothetical protein [Actinomycetota bacterium]
MAAVLDGDLFGIQSDAEQSSGSFTVCAVCFLSGVGHVPHAGKDRPTLPCGHAGDGGIPHHRVGIVESNGDPGRARRAVGRTALNRTLGSRSSARADTQLPGVFGLKAMRARTRGFGESDHRARTAERLVRPTTSAPSISSESAAMSALTSLSERPGWL